MTTASRILDYDPSEMVLQHLRFAQNAWSNDQRTEFIVSCMAAFDAKQEAQKQHCR